MYAKRPGVGGYSVPRFQRGTKQPVCTHHSKHLRPFSGECAITFTGSFWESHSIADSATNEWKGLQTRPESNRGGNEMVKVVTVAAFLAVSTCAAWAQHEN